MIMPSQFYNFRANAVMIGGARIRGFGEDGGIEYSFDSAIHEKMVSPDGQTVYSKQNNYDVQATITLHAQSTGHQWLWNLLQSQVFTTDNQGIVPIPFKHIDQTNGDLIICPNIVFMDFPEPNKGQNVSNVEYVIDLPNAAFTMQQGVKNIPNQLLGNEE